MKLRKTIHTTAAEARLGCSLATYFDGLARRAAKGEIVSREAIAKELGVSPQTVTAWAARLGYTWQGFGREIREKVA